MGFFKDIGKSISKTVSAVVKDAVPITAAVFTGGTSLSVLKPTSVMDRIDKATGLPVSAIANSVMSGGQSAAPTTTSAEVATQSILPPTQQQTATSIYDQITPYLNSFMQSSQQKSSDVAPNATYLGNQQPVQQASSGGSSKMMLIIGGVIALAVGAFFLFRGKK